MSWFKELYGYEAEERGEAYPALETPAGKTVVVEFLEEHPRVITTSYGQRAVINVKVGDDNYSLWLSRIGLAREIALLEKKVGTTIRWSRLDKGKKREYRRIAVKCQICRREIMNLKVKSECAAALDLIDSNTFTICYRCLDRLRPFIWLIRRASCMPAEVEQT